MWIWSERTYRPTSKKPHGKNPQAIKFLIFSISIFSVLAFWPPFDHYCAVALRNAGKACCDNQQQAFSCFGCSWVESTKFTFQRQSILPCRSSPTTATRRLFDLILHDPALSMLAKTQWSTVVRPRIDHYWKLTTLQDWNTLQRRFSYISVRSSAG